MLLRRHKNELNKQAINKPPKGKETIIEPKKEEIKRTTRRITKE